MLKIQKRGVSRSKLLELVDVKEGRCHFENFFYGSFDLRPSCRNLLVFIYSNKSFRQWKNEGCI